MATEKSVNYRRNRDYTKQFDWIYDLNCDLCNCYTKAKENPAIGYMKRMKQNWDIIHPEFSHLSDKKLRDQASRIIKNKIVMETEFSTDINTNWNSQSDNVDINNNETVNESINLVVNKTPTNINRNNVENNQAQEPPGYQLLKDKLKPIFLETIDILHNTNNDERTYLTRVNTKTTDTLLKCVDDLSKEYLTSLDSPNYWDINVCLYSAAVTCLREMNQLRELNLTNNKPKFPRWLTQLEESITYLRKTTGQLT